MSVAARERRIVSVLVADVAGSTSIAEKLGPERSKPVFDDVVRLMREEVERFGGTVAQLTGDGILALFGAPVAHEDDSKHAVRAALAIREAIYDYAAEVAPAYGLELRARVAVNTGLVVVPASDAPPHVLYNALGDTVNVAARLQAYGDLVVGTGDGAPGRRVVRARRAWESRAKGKERVGQRLPRRGRPRTTSRTPRSAARRPETGARGAERGIQGLIEGKGAIVSITGEPGIGKSRLVAEAKERFGGQVRFLAGHAVSYAETIPYWPVRELLRGWLGLGVSDPEARVRLELRAQLPRTLADEADEAYPLLATLLGLGLEPEQVQRMRDLSPDAVQHETFYWLYQLVYALARERPLCLVLEDLHWSDEATLSLLDELLPAAEQTAVSFVLVHRSDREHPAWQLVDRARRRFRRLFIGGSRAGSMPARSGRRAQAGRQLGRRRAVRRAQPPRQDDRGQPGLARRRPPNCSAWSPTARSAAASPSRCSRSCSKPARRRRKIVEERGLKQTSDTGAIDAEDRRNPRRQRRQGRSSIRMARKRCSASSSARR